MHIDMLSWLDRNPDFLIFFEKISLILVDIIYLLDIIYVQERSMNYRKLENILLGVLLVIVTAVYIWTVSPTLSFWDCGEFINRVYNQ